MKRVVASYFGRGEAGDRPIIFTVLFWFGLGSPLLARWFMDSSGAVLLPPVGLLVAAAVGLLVLWPLLPWSPGGRAWASWAFSAMALAFCTADGTGSNVPVLWMALAQVTLTRGVAAAVATGVVLLAWVGVATVWVFGKTWVDAGVEAAGAALLFGFCIALADVIGRERRERRRVQGLLAELERANATLHERNAQVRELAVAEERARLAREVHDAVGHHLTVVKLGLTNAQRLRSRDEEAAWAAVAESRDAAGTALEEVRRAVRALGPGPLAQSSLGSALERLASSYRTSALAVALDVRGPVRKLPPEAEATLYRVAEEALTNVHRHARTATRATIVLSYEPDAVHLAVEDDGRLEAEPAEGFGLAGARARLAAVGGSLDVAVAPQGGLRLAAAVPAGVAS